MSAILTRHTVRPNYIALPSGIIIPMNVTTVPDGWEAWSSADGKAIRAQNSNVGYESGSTAVSASTTTNGSHNASGGGLLRIHNCSEGGGGPYWFKGNNYRGNHYHTGYLTFVPQKREQKFIKAVGEKKVLPKDGIVMNHAFQSLEDCVDLTSSVEGGILGANSSVGNVSKVLTGSTGGVSAGHNHYTTATGNSHTYDGNPTYYDSNGAHTHSVTPSVTDNIKRYYTKMWRTATDKVKVMPGMLAMWESATPPEGWQLCDGTNGTPNLSDCFIGFNESKFGTFEGDNTINWSLGIVSKTHSHQGTRKYSGRLHWAYHTSGFSHGHSTISKSNVAWRPPYYTLVFITPITT